MKAGIIRKMLVLLALFCLLLPSAYLEGSPWFKEGGLLFVVNKKEKMDPQYAPTDLRIPAVATRKRSIVKNTQLRNVAASALEEMFNYAALTKGYELHAVSGFRSYGIQQINFNAKRKEVKNKESAAKVVAPPGASEHQTGLVMDIQCKGFPNLNPAFGEREEGKWLKDNAHKFGFILRYQKEFVETTGFSYEPWHFRYVGRQHAGAIFSLGISLEEYRDTAKLFPDYVLEKAADVLLSGLYLEAANGDRKTLDILHAEMDAKKQTELLLRLGQDYAKNGESYEKALLRCFPEQRKLAKAYQYDDEEVEIFK